MPEWMQIKVNNNRGHSMSNCFDKTGQNMVKSIHSYMHTRHFVITKEETDKSNAQANSNGPYRIYQWDENIANQRYDKIPITGKIGVDY